MTQFQQTAPAGTLVPSDRAYTTQFLAIVAGVVFVLMAAAVTSYVAGRPAEANIQATADTALTDGWQAAVSAAERQRDLDAANALTDGWAAALAPQRTSTATEAAGDGRINGLLLPEEAPVDGFTLRHPMQAEGASADDDTQRSIRAD